jgi:hypothetical protein
MRVAPYHRIRQSLSAVRPLAALCALGLAPCFASSLAWYTGNPEDALSATVGLTNEVSSAHGQANVYDEFIVPAGSGWDVTSVFSDDSMLGTTVVTQANWQIRSGVSSGNGGTLIASGASAASQDQIYSGAGYVIDTIQVNNLSVDLAPGTYWLSVAPVITNSDTAGTVPTNDAGAVGLPTENGMGVGTFDNYPSVGLDYFADPTSGGSPHDWSMGLYATPLGATPEPSAFGLMAIGWLAVWAAPRLRRQR